MLQPVDLKHLMKELKDPWMPIDIVRVNDSTVRMARIEGSYHWHTHRYSDEFFLVQDGKMNIQTAEGEVTLEKGQGVVVPKGTRHRSKSDKGAVALVFELQTTRKEGD
jgi:mannose-6-phosphate isomerase-like protein (cupin superfamily)